jgi:hypothetical protein
MAVVKTKFFLISLFILCFAKLHGKQDTTKTLVLGLESGYCSYASIDDIFIPFAYSGSAPFYSFNKTTVNKSSIRFFNVMYSMINRKPSSLSLKERFTILSYDAGQSSTWETDTKYLEVKTNVVKTEYSYLVKTPFQLFYHDILYVGALGKFDAVFRQDITNPELVSLTINPGIIYRIEMKKICNLILHCDLSLGGISVRKSYADAEAQITNSYNFSFFKDYVIDHLQYDFINTYFKTSSSIMLERPISSRVSLSLGYKFEYLNITKPKRLESVNNILSVGILYRIK